MSSAKPLSRFKSFIYIINFLSFGVQDIPAMAEEQIQRTETEVMRLSPVVVSATRVEQSSFNLPVSIDAIDRRQIQEGQARVNLSETLVRVPGVVVQNRQNYAQDLQISSRGFGSRAAFGVRGVRLIADGIPATLPDGQGQAATFSLSSASRIEVLRGPYSAVYGNHSGGVIQIFTEDGPGEPAAGATVVFGSYGTSRIGIQAGGQTRKLNYVLDLSHFETNGYRDHSTARRDHFNGKLKYALDGDSTLTLIINALDQPGTQDPLGLKAAQVRSNSRQADPAAIQFNTRKSIRHKQGGLTYERSFGGNDVLRVMGYYGSRRVTQFQSIPTGPQAAPTHPGGVIDFDRDFGGLGLRWTHKGALAEGPLTVTAGIDHDRSDEDRRGYQNFSGAQTGVRGALRRNENDEVASLDEYLQAEWQPAPRWTLIAGLRHSVVKFETRDFFSSGANPDDSGSVTHRNTSPAAGVLFRLTPALNLYANLGKGFETPTFNELFYKPDGTTGLNLSLKPSRSRNSEAGIKAFAGANTRVNLALFKIETTDEIVVASSTGGRTTFKNAGKTDRQGAELAVDSALGRGLDAYFSAAYLDASFKDAFTTCVGAPCSAVTVPVGKRLPGIPRRTLYGEISWKHALSGFSTVLEARYTDEVHVHDLNTDAPAGSYTVVNWRVGFKQRPGAWRFSQFLRIDNLFDKKYIGSVIVGDTNKRYYEPAPERSFMFGVSAGHSF